MQVTTLIGIFIPLTSALLDSRAVNDPGALYLSNMCYPEYFNTSTRYSLNDRIARLADSQFPCEQSLWIRGVCAANGTTPLDFLAEQQCLCNGGFFHASEGCNACYVAHGEVFPGEKPLEVLKSSLSSIKSLECSTGPPIQAFTNLFPEVNTTSARLRPAITLAPDPFLNDTAVSHYFTPTTVIAPGVITGSATARLTSWTNYSGVRYTPTGTPSGNSTQTSTTTPPPSSNAGSSPGVSAATTTATSASGNGAGGLNVQSAGGLLAAIVGVMILL